LRSSAPSWTTLFALGSSLRRRPGGILWRNWNRAFRLISSLAELRFGLPGLISGLLSHRQSPLSLRSSHLLVRQGQFLRELPLAVLDHQRQSEGRDDDQEHQGADAESPAGPLVLHDRGLQAVGLVETFQKTHGNTSNTRSNRVIRNTSIRSGLTC